LPGVLGVAFRRRKTTKSLAVPKLSHLIRTANLPNRSNWPTSPALAIHIMTNTALTGAAYDIDGGHQLVAA